MKPHQQALVAAIEQAVAFCLQRDTETPDEITDPRILIALLAPCPDCRATLDPALAGERMQADWEEDLLRSVLRQAIPQRWHPAVRAMMVHLDRSH